MASKDLQVPIGPDGDKGPIGPRGKQGPVGPRESTDSVISSIAKYLPIQMAERYLSQNGFVKYLINNSGSS